MVSRSPRLSPNDGPLTIIGRRLDGRAPSCIETYEGGAGLRLDDEFGCWKITGHYKDQELSFIVWVVPLTEQKSLSGGSTAEVLPEPSTSLPEPRRIHVDGSVQARSLVYRVAPELPHEARVANVSGTVEEHGKSNTFLTRPSSDKPPSMLLLGGSTWSLEKTLK